MAQYDIAIIGAGCIGASTAKHLAEAGHSAIVLEKESAPAMHQSGRNSGVIHAGYNLKPGSNKARYCVEGSRQMRAFCVQRGVAVEQGGILVVAQHDAQHAVIDDLLDKGRQNGVEVHDVDEAGIRELEPHAVGLRALHAPEGASVDAVGYVQALVADAEAAGATFQFDTITRDIRDPGRIRTSNEDIGAKVVVNAAGLQADRLARASDMRIVPFRGYYAQLAEDQRYLVRSHIYGAPDPRFPFLGVHLSRRVDGRVAVGPGAMLAMGREAYSFWKGHPRDAAGTFAWPGFWRMATSSAFLSQVRREIGKSLSPRAVGREAQGLVPAVDPSRLGHLRAGNRAQLVDRAGHLVDDIVVRETDDAVHVLNAVSPGLTCSLPFGAHLAERAASKL